METQPETDVPAAAAEEAATEAATDRQFARIDHSSMRLAHSVHRQAAALRLFEDKEGLGQITMDGRDIQIPKVIHYDLSRTMLILEDLGPFVTLWDFLSPETCGKLGSRTLTETCADMGNRIGRFFADLHSATKQQQYGFSIPAILGNSDTYQFFLDGAVQPVLERMKSQGIVTDAAERLYARALADYVRELDHFESVFAIGNFHPGCILVDLGWVSPNITTAMGRPLAVVHWEFSGIGRGANGDMAQFLASLHLMLLSLRQLNSRDSTDQVYKAVATFQSWVCAAYAALKLYPRYASMELLRSALIVHGREMIYQAVERDWGAKGLSVSEMVQAGVWYLERAGENVEEMQEEGNWKELMEEDHGVVLRLFGLSPGQRYSAARRMGSKAPWTRRVSD